MEYVHGDAGNSRYVLHSGFLHSTSYLIQHQPSEQNNRRLPYSNLSKPQAAKDTLFLRNHQENRKKSATHQQITTKICKQ